MVRKGQDMPTETRENMRGGKGSATICHLEKDLLPEKGRLFARIALDPGSSIGEHEHLGEAELFYFVSGEGTVTDDGVPVPVKAGDTLTTLSGHSHSVENTGKDALVIVAVIIKE